MARVTTVKRTAQVVQRRRRLVAMCSALPEVSSSVMGRANQHLVFRVRKKTFAYYLYDHHGDGRIVIWCKAAPGEQASLVGQEPRRFFVPPYLGPSGWVGVRLDLARSDGARSPISLAWRIG